MNILRLGLVVILVFSFNLSYSQETRDTTWGRNPNSLQLILLINNQGNKSKSPATADSVSDARGKASSSKVISSKRGFQKADSVHMIWETEKQRRFNALKGTSMRAFGAE